MNKHILLLVSLSTTLVFASQQPVATDSGTKLASNSGAKQQYVVVNGQKVPVQTCPLPSAFKKDPNSLLWADGKSWQSHEQSFATKLGKFMGAQWSGVALGQIICLYQPANKLTFPVQVDYGVLTREPMGGSWSKNLGGYRNCSSNSVSDCAFIPQPTAKKMDPYQALEQYKEQHPDANEQQGF